jgi:O-antigen biosynthesis protein WbqP
MIMKRIFDICVAIPASIVLAVPIALIALIIRLTSPGPALYWSDRVGINNTLFRMPKFRTMRTGTPAVATHLLADPDAYVTPIGRFLRKTSLDELPQLYSIIKGDMSFVGPRPALFNQDDLVALRTACGVHRILPGLTGWAQINGRDELEIPVKVAYDEYYLKNQSFWFDLKILFLTLVKVLNKEGVSH